jgi:hypothetical protein
MDRNYFALVTQEIGLCIGFPQRRLPSTEAAFLTISVLFVGRDASVSETTALLF